ncbi:hypothetical protein CDAR_201171 [Caerostris darwini]|uniref:Uncharacterized protein n=1 Tax=Caerostris darwini TaxID=1538125 RepID=A0AAV4P4C0_9ARAC|nr:hypothetical protein CDAR_201171 [Caerostris darwini]
MTSTSPHQPQGVSVVENPMGEHDGEITTPSISIGSWISHPFYFSRVATLIRSSEEGSPFIHTILSEGSFSMRRASPKDKDGSAINEQNNECSPYLVTGTG